MLLGYIDPDYYLGGEIKLDRAAAHDAMSRLASRLGITPTEAAEGVFRIINTNMLNGIRVVSVEKGHDPRDFSILSFGGAGGIHASTLIEQLGIDRVIIPTTASAFSAFGLLCTDLRRDFVTTIYQPLMQLTDGGIRNLFRTMEREGRKGFGLGRGSPDLWYEYSADMRYAGQGHDIRVNLDGPLAAIGRIKIVAAFNRAYEQAYGYLEDESNVQLVNLRVVACLGTDKPEIPRMRQTRALAGGARKGTRDVFFSEKKAFLSTPIYDGHQLRPGNRVQGPAIIELATTTAVLRPGQNLRVDPYGNFIAARKGVVP